jgi:hypothetical protein
MCTYYIHIYIYIYNLPFCHRAGFSAKVGNTGRFFWSGGGCRCWCLRTEGREGGREGGREEKKEIKEGI